MRLIASASTLACLILFAPVVLADDTPSKAADSAESAAPEAPEQLVQRYFELMQSEGMGAIADLMHPAELEKFRDMLLPVFTTMSDAGDRTMIDMTFGTEASIEDVQKASPADFMKGFMNIIEAQLGGESIEFDELTVLGHVPEGDVVHVVARVGVGLGELSMTEMEVISLRPYEGSWRMQLTGEMEGMAQMLQSQLAAQQGAAETE